MRFVAIIPARIASTRLPRKPLREIAGKPMLQRVYEAARGCRGFSDVIVATDSEEIVALAAHHGWTVRMTSAECRSGTDRVREVAQAIDADIYVNVQGDEPLARPEQMETLLALMQTPGVSVGTLKTRCRPEDVQNPNAVKVVTDLEGRALYFSRSAVPFDRDQRGATYFKHLGFYAYTRGALESFCQWPESELEKTERLEQLRFLDHGVEIYVAETPFDSIGVDVEDDVKKVEEILRREGRA